MAAPYLLNKAIVNNRKYPQGVTTLYSVNVFQCNTRHYCIKCFKKGLDPKTG